MEQKLLKTPSTSGPSKWKSLQYGSVFFIFIAVVSVGLVGYFLGRVSVRCERQVGDATVEGDQSGVIRVPPESVLINQLTVNMDMSPVFGDCLCTTEPETPLLKDADVTSETLNVLEKGQCFRYIENFLWQTENHELYRMLNTNDNQVGWILRDYLKRSDSCSMPPVTKETYDLGLKVEFAGGVVSQQCLQCICNLESNCRPLGCRMDVGSLSCGYFQIKNAYWTDCGKPGTNLEACGKDQYCSSLCVQRYMARYVPGSGCARTCETYAREHNGGPRGCKSSSTIGYWNRLIRLPGCHNPAGLSRVMGSTVGDM